MNLVRNVKQGETDSLKTSHELQILTYIFYKYTHDNIILQLRNMLLKTNREQTL